MNIVENKISNESGDRIESISGIILAGGKSTRMGSDKAMLKIGGTPAIERIYDTVSGIFRDTMIISDRPENYAYLTSNIHPDIYHSMGPLGGIHSALANAKENQIFVVSCDMPLIHESAIRYIISRIDNTDITLPVAFGRLQPLCGIYSKNCLPVFEGILSGAGKSDCSKSRELKLIRALESFDIGLINTIDFDRLDLNRDCFLNMNNKEDYDEICGIAGL